MSLGLASAMVGLDAGGIVFAAAQYPTPSASTTPASNTGSGATAVGKRAAITYTVSAVSGAAIMATESDTGARVTFNTSALTALDILSRGVNRVTRRHRESCSARGWTIGR